MTEIKYPHVQKAKKYADDVVNGRIPSCKWIVLACKRFKTDLHRAKTKAFPYILNKDRAEANCTFIELLPHVKGKWAGNLLVLEPWQCFLFVNLFGWEHKSTKLRRFRRAFVLVPRKNGKTTIAAPVGIDMMTLEAEPGAEIYCGATSEDQANEVFRPAKAMVNRAKGLKTAYNLQVAASAIFREDGLSFFHRLIGKPGEGQSPYCAISDEYHEHKTSEQIDAMWTGMGARQQPLQFIITTAGTDISSPCKEMDDYCRKILDGVLEDERWFIMIYALEDDADWENFENWKKVNPNINVSVSEEFLHEKYQESLQRVSTQNINRCKHLNQWMNAGSAWMNMSLWNKCKDVSLSLNDFKGRDCFLGMDLASKIDIAALILLFPMEDDKWAVFGKYYLPEDTINLPENAQYQTWEHEGWLTKTPGARTDFFYIEEDLKQYSSDFNIQELAFDPRESTYLVNNIMEWGDFECVEIPQGPAHISEPMKELEAIIYDNKIRHNGDPVLSWMVSNTVRKEGRGGPVKYYYPTKDNNENKIDGVVALIMAISRAMTYEDMKIEVFRA